MKQNFDEWLKTFRSSICDYKYYVDFEKVYKNVDSIKIELNILNTLIGTQHFEDDFRKLINQYPEVLKCIPILLAVRQREIEVISECGKIIFNFNELSVSIDEYIYFLNQTGLSLLIQNHLINNLVDYVTGIEVGLDSNGRKNRGGHLMEDLLENYIKEMNVEYYKEIGTKEIEAKWNIDLTKITNKGDAAKRFDFAIKTEKQVYVFETNFYKSSGSKLNETARSYKSICQEIRKINGITFIWVTDGLGWKNARHNLKETYDIMDTILNIQDLEQGELYNIIDADGIIKDYEKTLV